MSMRHFIAVVALRFDWLRSLSRLALAVAAARRGCRSEAGVGRPSAASASPEIAHPGSEHRTRQRMAAWWEAHSRAGLDRDGIRHGLDHPRWLYVLPNGDVLVAETNAPPEAARRQGDPRMGPEEGHEARRLDHAQRQPDHPVAGYTGAGMPMRASCLPTS